MITIRRIRQNVITKINWAGGFMRIYDYEKEISLKCNHKLLLEEHIRDYIFDHLSKCNHESGRVLVKYSEVVITS